MNEPFEIFAICAPGLETALQAEVRSLGFPNPRVLAGGVAWSGSWRDVWRANLGLRGAARVLARLGEFRALHLAQLDKRARKFPWAQFLRPDVPARVEATCKSSRIYHAGAAAQRIETAIREELGAPIAKDADVVIKARIEDDLCVISVDSSGESLHKRGSKEEIGKAPMRENMAALFLRMCGYQGTEPVLDPMCGSGTFVLEAAEIAAALQPGRARHFAFEKLAGFDAAQFGKLKAPGPGVQPAFSFHGSDRDPGAIRMSRANAERAGVADFTEFRELTVTELQRPDGPPGLVIVNPPYGARIGDKRGLNALHVALGQSLKDKFSGWRVGLITSEPGLAKATGLPFGQASAPVAHGGLRVHLFQTKPL